MKKRMARANKKCVVNGNNFIMDKIISKERGDKLKLHQQYNISFTLKKNPGVYGYRLYRRCKTI